MKSPTPDHKATKATPKVIMTSSKSPTTLKTSTAKPLPSYKQPDHKATNATLTTFKVATQPNTTQMKFPTPNLPGVGD